MYHKVDYSNKIDGIVVEKKPLVDHLEVAVQSNDFHLIEKFVSDKRDISEKIIKSNSQLSSR